MKNKFYIESYGCAMNFSDSEIVASILNKEGYKLSKNPEEANLILINTCSIRDKAEQTIRKRLKLFNKYKKNTNELKIGILGCMAERLKGKFLEEAKEKGQKMGIILVRATPIMEVLTGFMIAGLIYCSAIMVNNGTLEINNFFSFLAAMMLSYQPVRALATLNIGIKQSLSGARRVFEVIDLKRKIGENLNAKDLVIDKAKIEYKDVSFAYDGEKEVLKSINLKMEGGDIIALVGHSGAGKTTIMNLIPRFYNTSSGEILIDNQSIHKVSLFSLRKNISLVSQDITLFDDTVLSNIAYADSKASKEKILEASKFSATHDFVEQLPEKYDTLIGENGVRLSGGEKQRISIARAILKDTPIILLDEATSSLDADTEHKIQGAIMYLTKNKTTIIIAHRLSTVLRANKIFIIENGRVVAEGNHNYLLENSEIYKNFYNKQLRPH